MNSMSLQPNILHIGVMALVTTAMLLCTDTLQYTCTSLLHGENLNHWMPTKAGIKLLFKWDFQCLYQQLFLTMNCLIHAKETTHWQCLSLFCVKSFILKHSVIDSLLCYRASHHPYSTWGNNLQRKTPHLCSPLNKTWQQCSLVIRSPAAALSRSFRSIDTQSRWTPSNPSLSEPSSTLSVGWRKPSNHKHHSCLIPVVHLELLGNHALI